MRQDRHEAGTATVELVLILPVLIVLLFFVVALGRLARARADIDGAARDAARAASIQPDAAAAQAAANQTVSDNLDAVDRTVTCVNHQVVTDVSQFQPGGSVSVTVSCEIRLADLGIPGLPGTRTVQARFVEVIDRFRPVG